MKNLEMVGMDFGGMKNQVARVEVRCSLSSARAKLVALLMSACMPEPVPGAKVTRARQP